MEVTWLNAQICGELLGFFFVVVVLNRKPSSESLCASLCCVVSPLTTGLSIQFIMHRPEGREPPPHPLTPSPAAAATPFLSKLIVSTPAESCGRAHCHTTSGRGRKGRESEERAHDRVCVCVCTCTQAAAGVPKLFPFLIFYIRGVQNTTPLRI